MSIPELYDALVARIQTAADGDTDAVLDRLASSDAGELHRQASEANGGPVPGEICHILGWFHWTRYQALPEGEASEDLRTCLAWFEAVYTADPQAEIPDEMRRYLTGGMTDNDGHARQAQAAAEILQRVMHVDDPAALDQAIALLTTAIDATPHGHPNLAGYLSNLGIALKVRFGRTGGVGDLDEAVTVARQAIAVTPDGDPDLALYLFNLGIALQVRFGRTGGVGDLDEAVIVGRQAIAVTPDDHPDLAGYLSILGGALRVRFGRTGGVGDLDEAVTVGRQAIAATPKGDPNLALYLSNLGIALEVQFGRTGKFGDLDEAVTVARQAIAATPDNHPNLAGYLSILGGALRVRFERTGGVGDLDEAVTVGRQAIAATPKGDPNLAINLSNLGIALKVRFGRTGGVGDLDEAVIVGRQAIAATLDDHPDLAACLSILGNALRVRFGRTGEVGDLDEAVTVARQAIHTTPDNHPDLAKYLFNLGIALQARFGRTGGVGDLDEAVTVGRQAIAATLDDHPDLAACLSTLGNALRVRFERTGEVGDLDEAVTVARQAIHTTPDNHPDLAKYLSNLGIALQARFGRTGEVGDRDEAVTVARQAIDATPDGHPNLATYLSNLGIALQVRFGRTGEVGDLDEAVIVGRQAIDATPDGHPKLATYLSNLGGALQVRFERTGEVGDLREGIGLWSLAAASDAASVSVRLRAAQSCARATFQLDGPAAAVGVYMLAVGMLPLLAWRGVSDADRRFLLDRGASSLARDAAACAIAAGDAAQAIGFLEQGRSVVWAQLLDGRTDLTDLRHAHPHLATQLEACRAVLDQPTRPDIHTPSEPDQLRSLDRIAGDARRDAARRFDALVNLVRAQPPTDGFPQPQQFLQPPQVDALLPGNGDGQVIVVNVSEWRCDALILDHTGITHIALPDLTQDAVIDAANRYLDALHAFERTRRDRGLMEMAITSTLGWLWDHIAGPILDQLGHTTTDSGVFPRVWWCPTGALTILPLHAAGHHATHTGRTVHDRVVSSYTPTLRALTHTRTRPAPAAEQHLLVLAMPHTPGQNALPGADTERQTLATLFDATHRTELVNDTATRAAVIAALPRHQVLHASCHGTQNLGDPARGGLLSHDWETAGLVSIADLTGADQTGGEFAFLSACKTATGGVTNLDETITVATAMQHAGWRHVIGTLWSVWDDTAAIVTAGVYPSLTRNGVLDPTHAAHALHHTIRTLRDHDPTRPSTWAPFIHTGP